jgi:hypothetical protein
VGTSSLGGGACIRVHWKIPAQRMRAPGIFSGERDLEPDEFNRPVPISELLTLQIKDRGRVMVWS